MWPNIKKNTNTGGQQLVYWYTLYTDIPGWYTECVKNNILFKKAESPVEQKCYHTHRKGET